MSDYTITKNLGLFKPTYDADEEQWGYHLNSNADTLDGVLASDGSGQFLPLAGGTMQGTLTLFTNPTAALDAVSKQYLDGKMSTMLPIAGGTMTGPLTLFSDPASALQPVTLQYYNAHLPAPTPPPNLSGYAPIASPAFTGNPTAPTPAPNDNDTSIATTAFVAAALGGVPGGAVIADVAPTALPGALWWDSVGCQLYVRYNDGNSTAWVNATNAGLGTIQVSDTAPANAAQNSLWFCSTDLMLYVRYYDGNSTQWVPALNLPASVGEAPVDTSVYGRSGQAWTKVTPLTAGNVGRNTIHNSMMNIAQRGTGPFTAGGAYTLDRWFLGLGGDAASVTQQNFSMGGLTVDESAKRLLQNVFTGGAAAGNLVLIYQPIEDVTRLAAKTVIVSFWATAASGTPKFGVSLDQIFGTGGSPSANVLGNGQSVTLNTTWTRYSLTFTLPSIAGKTLGTNGNDFTELVFWYSSGATNATRSGNVGVQSGTIYLWGVQLEIAQPGQTQPTSLEKLDPVTQLQQCQRFYTTGQIIAAATGSAGGNFISAVSLPVSMRAFPTMTAGTNASSNLGTVSIAALNNTNVYASATPTASNNTVLNIMFTASADL